VRFLFYNVGMSRRNSLDRVVFLQPGAQKKFIIQTKENLSMSWEELGKLVHAHPRSLRDWAREKFHMSHESALLLEKESGISLTRKIEIKKWADHARRAGRIGGRSLVKKYGRVAENEQYREEKWRQWWEETGRQLPSSIHNEALPFNAPVRSEMLAEFVGVMLGDGGITKYQLAVTLHRYDDEPYRRFVKKLFLELFHLKASIFSHKRGLADSVVVSRIKIVEYAVKELELMVGNKVRQQVDIPQWIKSDRKLMIACVRGLVDTDGCVFTHKYIVNGKQYAYKKLCFTNHSRPLLLSVFDALSALGMNPRIARGEDVRLDIKKDINTYFQIIGTSNPKHLKRYKK